jgi:hypothetical protein
MLRQPAFLLALPINPTVLSEITKTYTTRFSINPHRYIFCCFSRIGSWVGHELKQSRYSGYFLQALLRTFMGSARPCKKGWVRYLDTISFVSRYARYNWRVISFSFSFSSVLNIATSIHPGRQLKERVLVGFPKKMNTASVALREIDFMRLLARILLFRSIDDLDTFTDALANSSDLHCELNFEHPFSTCSSRKPTNLFLGPLCVSHHFCKLQQTPL